MPDASECLPTLVLACVSVLWGVVGHQRRSQRESQLWQNVLGAASKVSTTRVNVADLYIQEGSEGLYARAGAAIYDPFKGSIVLQ